jgi:DNA-binding response OmpR family regulator
MDMEDKLAGKRILIVDDEPDIIDTLAEMLDMCLIDSAPDFDTAKKFLDKNRYDAAILDIMGVRGYDLLEITSQRGIPSLMLTAHALSPDNLVKSIKGGAQAYVPKDKISEIATFVREVIEAGEKGGRSRGEWFERLEPFFDKKFGPGWKEKHKEFWKEFDKNYVVSKDELSSIM